MLNSRVYLLIWLNISKLIHPQPNSWFLAIPCQNRLLQSSLSTWQLYLNSFSVHKPECHDWVLFSLHIPFPIHKQTLSDLSPEYFKSEHSSFFLLPSPSPSYWFLISFCLGYPAFKLLPSQQPEWPFYNRSCHTLPQNPPIAFYLFQKNQSPDNCLQGLHESPCHQLPPTGCFCSYSPLSHLIQTTFASFFPWRLQVLLGSLCLVFFLHKYLAPLTYLDSFPTLFRPLQNIIFSRELPWSTYMN